MIQEAATLVASRAVKIFPQIKMQFEALGFSGVAVTGEEKEELDALIEVMQPRLLIMDCMFYQCCTPYFISKLHKQFPELNIAVISLMDYPADLAMYCVIDGARSYLNLWDGTEQFYYGLKEVREGRAYLSPGVAERIDIRSAYPKPTGDLTRLQIEIVRLICNGWTGKEIAEMLDMGLQSVNNRKSEIYTALNVRNENEAIRAALDIGIITRDEQVFFPKNHELKPFPPKKRKVKREERKVILMSRGKVIK